MKKQDKLLPYWGEEKITLKCIKPTSTLTKNKIYIGYKHEKYIWQTGEYKEGYRVVNDNGNAIFTQKNRFIETNEKYNKSDIKEITIKEAMQDAFNQGYAFHNGFSNYKNFDEWYDSLIKNNNIKSNCINHLENVSQEKIIEVFLYERNISVKRTLDYRDKDYFQAGFDFAKNWLSNYTISPKNKK